MEIDWLAIARQYGPAAASVVGSIVTGALTLIWATLMLFWRMQKRRMDKVDVQIGRLCRSVREGREQASEENEKMRETLASYRSEVVHLKAQVEPLKASVQSIEGAVKTQNTTINNYVERMGEVNGQLDTVFRFIESYPRSKIERLK